MSNSFPSGHTTIAMTVLFAFLMVVPYRWRGVTMLVVLPWATSIGVYTINAKWHRLSDVIGAAGVSLLRGTDFTLHDSTVDHTAFLGANTLAAGVSGLVALMFWGLWHRLEIPRTSRR